MHTEIIDSLLPRGSQRRRMIRSLYLKFVNFTSRFLMNMKEDKDLVTVVIPIYDRVEELKDSIDSILNQTYKNIELILVCDGSPKKTLDIVRMYENNKKVRIFYYDDNSGNAVRGRNKGIMEARGKYLAFQDSDDIADKDRIKKSLYYIKKYNVDVVYGGWKALMDGSRQIDGIEDGQEVYSPDCNFESLKNNCIPCQSTVMVRLEAVKDVGGLKPNMRYREDHELWLRMEYYGYKFKSIPLILTSLRLHSGNLEVNFKNDDDKWFELMLSEYKNKGKIKPTIGYIIPGCGISGGIAVVCQHVNRLKDRGYSVVLISEDNKEIIDWFPNQKVDVIPMCKFNMNLDIVVATGWSTAYSALKVNAKRKMYFVQSDETRFYPKESKEVMLASKTYEMDFEFFTEAKWIQKWLHDTYGKEADYVPNGLDENIIFKVPPIVPKGERVRVLLEGPICIPFKGMEDAFEAVNDLDCEIWCVSSAGKPKKNWRCDKFFEHVPFDKMREIYSSCDIFLKMSRVEGFFGPPMEMMACGGACVVSKVTGYDEYIKDGYNALVVDMGDVLAARNAVNKLIHDVSLRKMLIENGYKTVSNWKWDGSIDMLEKIIIKDEL